MIGTCPNPAIVPAGRLYLRQGIEFLYKPVPKRACGFAEFALRVRYDADSLRMTGCESGTILIRSERKSPAAKDGKTHPPKPLSINPISLESCCS